MARVHPVILAAGDEEHLGVGLVGLEVLVGRVGRDGRTLFRNTRIAVLRHPGRTRGELMVPEHVEQRHGANDGRVQIRTLGVGHANEETTVRTALDTKAILAGNAALDQRFGDRVEVVVGTLPVQLLRRLVPLGSQLTAASDVGDGIHPAPLEPELTNKARVVRKGGDVEATVSVEDGGSVAGFDDRLLADHEVGHAGAISAGCPPLLGDDASRIVERWHRFPRSQLTTPRDVIERVRSRRVLEGDQEVVPIIRVVTDSRHADARQLDLFGGPLATEVFLEPHHAADDVVQEGDHHRVLSDEGATHRLTFTEAVDGLHLLGLHVVGDERPDRDHLAIVVPLLTELDDQVTVEDALHRPFGGQRKLLQRSIFHQLQQLALMERDRAAEERVVHLALPVAGDPDPGADV